MAQFSGKTVLVSEDISFLKSSAFVNALADVSHSAWGEQLWSVVLGTCWWTALYAPKFRIPANVPLVQYVCESVWCDVLNL